jgi:hypothetical protein
LDPPPLVIPEPRTVLDPALLVPSTLATDASEPRAAVKGKNPEPSLTTPERFLVRMAKILPFATSTALDIATGAVRNRYAVRITGLEILYRINNLAPLAPFDIRCPGSPIG